MKIGNTLKKKGLCPVCTAKRLMRGVKFNDRENAPCPADASARSAAARARSLVL